MTNRETPQAAGTRPGPRPTLTRPPGQRGASEAAGADTAPDRRPSTAADAPSAADDRWIRVTPLNRAMPAPTASGAAAPDAPTVRTPTARMGAILAAARKRADVDTAVTRRTGGTGARTPSPQAAAPAPTTSKTGTAPDRAAKVWAPGTPGTPTRGTGAATAGQGPETGAKAPAAAAGTSARGGEARASTAAAGPQGPEAGGTTAAGSAARPGVEAKAPAAVTGTSAREAETRVSTAAAGTQAPEAGDTTGAGRVDGPEAGSAAGEDATGGHGAETRAEAPTTTRTPDARPTETGGTTRAAGDASDTGRTEAGTTVGAAAITTDARRTEAGTTVRAAAITTDTRRTEPGSTVRAVAITADAGRTEAGTTARVAEAGGAGRAGLRVSPETEVGGRGIVPAPRSGGASGAAYTPGGDEPAPVRLRVVRGRHRKPRRRRVLFAAGGLALAAGVLSLTRMTPDAVTGSADGGHAEAEPVATATDNDTAGDDAVPTVAAMPSPTQAGAAPASPAMGGTSPAPTSDTSGIPASVRTPAATLPAAHGAAPAATPGTGGSTGIPTAPATTPPAARPTPPATAPAEPPRHTPSPSPSATAPSHQQPGVCVPIVGICVNGLLSSGQDAQ
ncbi:hypothetical protein ACFXAW_28560 [Streptomyces sp. NPDC059445]|uniref:hypothetical protein n=1 Tax=Streptomyces sp. NPDC059445 TaxID=3346832 RepID=UPI0036B07B73